MDDVTRRCKTWSQRHPPMKSCWTGTRIKSSLPQPQINSSQQGQQLGPLLCRAVHKFTFTKSYAEKTNLFDPAIDCHGFSSR